MGCEAGHAFEMEGGSLDQKNLKKGLVFLTGFMGSGKSTIGPILANALGWEFVDVDKWIESKTDKKIVDIFSATGEQAFRALEQQTLRELLARNECVVSLGGGTLANEENFEFIRNNGIIVYLQLSSDNLLERVKYKTDRPMLKDPEGRPLQGEELKDRIDELLEVRERYYSRAHIIIPADAMKVGPTVDAIVKKLRGLIT
jgi:shikimate kinase